MDGSKGENHSHMCALTEDGTVWVCGDGYKFKLGLVCATRSIVVFSHRFDDLRACTQGDDSSRALPTPLPRSAYANAKATGVSCGGIHSVMHTDSHELYAWGCGSDGRLGFVEIGNARYLYKEKAPRAHQQFAGKGVAIAASYYHTVALVAP
jgi:regulator of chromosome condensation